jgi:hypothetical protein
MQINTTVTKAKLDMKTALWILKGVSILLGVIALIMLISGNWGGFFGTLIISLGFFGFGWAGQRLFSGDDNPNPRQGVSQIIAVIFGGAGGMMLIGSVWLLVEGEFGGFIGLGIFGLVFCVVAYFGSRVFAVPKGMKEVLVGSATTQIEGVMGQSGQLSEGSYRYVEENIPETEIKKMQQKWTEQPWTQRDDWAQGKVVQQGPGSIRMLVGFTVVWNLIACGIAGFGILSEWGQPDFPWFLFIFPAVGLALVIWTVLIWIRRRKFGISIMDLKTVPFYPGDWLRGTVHTGVRVRNEPAKEFKVRLVCAQRTSVLDSEGDRRVSEKDVWSTEQKVYGSIATNSDTFDVPINLAIPGYLPPTALQPEDDRNLWRLEISTATRGVDYAAQFEVPVYNKDKV